MLKLDIMRKKKNKTKTCTLRRPVWLGIKWHYKLVCSRMVYTELGPRRQQFHVVPAMQQLNSAVTISVDIKTRCEKLQSLIQSRIQPERSGSAH